MKHICITGATGLIGGALLTALSSRKELRLTAMARTLVAPESGGEVQWVSGDLASLSDCLALVAGQDVIIHLAHKNAPLTSDRDLPGDALLNLLPTLNLIQAIQQTGRRPHVIFASSGGAVYGHSHGPRPFAEDHPCLPINSYGIQKLAAEHYLRLAAERGYFTATVLRIANVYGWLLSPARKQGFIGTALFQAMAGQPIRIFGNPENVRDYVHINDVLEVFVRCLTPGQDFDLFNIGTGHGTSVRRIVDLLEECLGRPLAREEQAFAGADFLPPWCVLDIARARDLMDWTPQVSLQEGVAGMVAAAAEKGKKRLNLF